MGCLMAKAGLIAAGNGHVSASFYQSQNSMQICLSHLFSFSLHLDHGRNKDSLCHCQGRIVDLHFAEIQQDWSEP